MVTTFRCKNRTEFTPNLQILIFKLTFLRFFDEVAIVAWCTVSYPDPDIHEVFSLEDFDNCENFSDYPVHFTNDYDVEGFIVRPSISPLVRYFVSRSQCNAGLKVKIMTNTGPE